MSVMYLSQPDHTFSDLYLDVREKENRIFPDEIVQMLPSLPKKHPLHSEWKLRKKSASRFISYLKSKNKPLKILDIGCGNGWFSHLMATVKNTEVTGLEINIQELQQADEVFQKPKLKFIYANLYESTSLLKERFDIIVFNSCFQYFEDTNSILGIVKNMLAENGEIHIIDTLFYLPSALETAKLRTANYYESLGFPEMSKYYFHHTFDALGKHQILYKPSFLVKLLNDSPFCWIKINS